MNIQDILKYKYWGNKEILSATSKATHEQFLASTEFPYYSLGGTCSEATATLTKSRSSSEDLDVTVFLNEFKI
jgi:hypothetical protein